MNDDPVLQAIRGLVEAEPGVRFAYLFGSRAGGRPGPLSDYDVAVFVRKGTDLFRFRLAFLEKLGIAAGNAPVDLVILNQAPPVLAHRVLCTGKVIKEARSARVPFETRVLREYLDTEHLRRTQRGYLRKQFGREASHG